MTMREMNIKCQSMQFKQEKVKREGENEDIFYRRKEEHRNKVDAMLLIREKINDDGEMKTVEQKYIFQICTYRYIIIKVNKYHASVI